jgi:hypothetical protein
VKSVFFIYVKNAIFLNFKYHGVEVIRRQNIEDVAVATSALLSGMSHKEDPTRRMACTIYILLLLTAVRRTEGVLFRSVFKAPLNRNMASQKSMRAFFQTTKSSENLPNKKSRSDEPLVSAERSISHFASAGPSLGGREEGDAEMCYCPPGLTDERWKSILSKEFSKAYFKSLMAFVDEESAKFSVYPPKEQIFSAFNLCSFDQIKVRFLSSVVASI